MTCFSIESSFKSVCRSDLQLGCRVAWDGGGRVLGGGRAVHTLTSCRAKLKPMHLRGPALKGTQEPMWDDLPSLLSHLPSRTNHTFHTMPIMFASTSQAGIRATRNVIRTPPCITASYVLLNWFPTLKYHGLNHTGMNLTVCYTASTFNGSTRATAGEALHNTLAC